ncbi:hypothetical protein ACFYWN_19075 [Streptomyces sp. NPDC002917]|uniref:hypothetical protein n=1 Tax=unclassified Streptomyces TaxID=2593676 RepID=UPI002E8092DC|nr:hypothetical protein [Streptomyces sp. NBC_00562]WTD37687.1 hypothetical protein OHB03_38945 [Streptomyces sp. NBC_01643]WUC24063.1 hypothetical protein OHA33_37420 [Streptomyces sp. NBC_00562]
MVFAEDASAVHTGNTPRAMAAYGTCGRLRLLGTDNITKTTQAFRDTPEHTV